GDIGLVLKNDVYRLNAEIGYWLAEPHWNKGIATAALKETVDYAFKIFAVNTIYACVFEQNKVSMKVLLKSGFQLESIQKNWVIKNSIVMDEYVFTIRRK
ncbi:MAG: GNAT family protein, partial [Chitinophagales bacterium]